MNLKELLELTKEKNLEELRKEKIVPCRANTFRDYIKKIGCEPIGAGKSGWKYDNVSPELLEKELVDLLPLMGIRPKAKNKKDASNTNNVYTNNLENSEDSQEVIESDKIGNNDSNNTKENEGEHKMTKDVIAMMLKGIAPEKPEKEFIGFYAEGDVARAIKQVKQGKKSEFINAVIRAYLKDNNLM